MASLRSFMHESADVTVSSLTISASVISHFLSKGVLHRVEFLRVATQGMVGCGRWCEVLGEI